MFSLFQQKGIIAYVVLFLISVVVRIPSFHAEHVLADEALYHTCAERINEKGSNYDVAWENKPPLLVGMYSFVGKVSGKYAWIVIRVLAIIWIYLTAILLAELMNTFRLLPQYSLLPALFYVLCCAIPWHTQEFNGELFMNLPIVLSLLFFIKTYDETARYDFWLYPKIGLAIFFAFWFKYQAITHLAAILFAYLFMQSFKGKHFWEIIFFFALPIILFCALRLLSGHFSAFWDIGIVYNLDYILIGKNPYETLSATQGIVEVFKGWNILLLFAVFGFFLWYFGKNYYNIQGRKAQNTIIITFLFALIGVGLGYKRLYFHYIVQLAPFVAIGLSIFLLSLGRKWLVRFSQWAIYGLIVWNIALYAVVVSPTFFALALENKLLKKGGWINEQHLTYTHQNPIWNTFEKVIHTHTKPEDKILILSFRPDWYVKLDRHCATKYTNFSIAYYKMSFFKHNQSNILISNPETLSAVYDAFTEELPTLFIDEHHLFEELQPKLPTLLTNYKKIPTIMADIYVKV